jgi:hypothetical protein
LIANPVASDKRLEIERLGIAAGVPKMKNVDGLVLFHVTAQVVVHRRLSLGAVLLFMTAL